MRKPRRLSDDLPASELIRQGAPDWQIAHGLVYLAEQIQQRFPKTPAWQLVGHHSPLHLFIHVQDLGLSRRKIWVKDIILPEVERLELRLRSR